MSQREEEDIDLDSIEQHYGGAFDDLCADEEEEEEEERATTEVLDNRPTAPSTRKVSVCASFLSCARGPPC